MDKLGPDLECVTCFIVVFTHKNQMFANQKIFGIIQKRILDTIGEETFLF